MNTCLSSYSVLLFLRKIYYVNLCGQYLGGVGIASLQNLIPRTRDGKFLKFYFTHATDQISRLTIQLNTDIEQCLQAYSLYFCITDFRNVGWRMPSRSY
ncbi:Uncharacterised protein [Collinsella aerofaciens]|nr:Uncharacterised protein [Collinsella aerofaciens]